MVLIKWFGHACVSVETSDGYTVVFDPHDGYSIGLKKPNVKADLVLVSHEHFDHNAVEVVTKEGTRVLREFHGETEINGITIKGFKTFHDKYEGRRRGLNTVYIVVVEGQRIAHLGDLGHIPSEELINELRNVDLLMIPVGGTYTIYPDEAWKLIELTNPVNILPIHYWIEGLRLPLHSIEDFLVHVKKYTVIRLDTNSFELERYEKNVILLKL
ncbi:MAG: Zn-dependent hydrolase [Desulfurococcales archaeon ex4484_58]|nr:MAG: Zn-dependent hydrolase [Desulfurococcales archaeon ex4484_58]